MLLKISVFPRRSREDEPTDFPPVNVWQEVVVAKDIPSAVAEIANELPELWTDSLEAGADNNWYADADDAVYKFELVADFD